MCIFILMLYKHHLAKSMTEVHWRIFKAAKAHGEFSKMLCKNVQAFLIWGMTYTTHWYSQRVFCEGMECGMLHKGNKRAQEHEYHDWSHWGNFTWIASSRKLQVVPRHMVCLWIGRPKQLLGLALFMSRGLARVWVSVASIVNYRKLQFSQYQLGWFPGSLIATINNIACETGLAFPEWVGLELLYIENTRLCLLYREFALVT